MATNRDGQFNYPEKSWAEGKMRKRGEKVSEALPDMTGWDPKYIKEYLEGKDKAFQENEKVNKSLRDTDRKYNQPAGKQKRSEAEGTMQMAKMDRLQRVLPGEGGQLAEMDRAAGMGTAARGGPTGTMQVPAAVVPTQKYAAEAIAQHKDFIKDNLNEVAQGNMSPDIFKRMLKQFGWEGNPESGEFKDPNGTTHRIEAEAK
jgi:hypothetical protein